MTEISAEEKVDKQEFLDAQTFSMEMINIPFPMALVDQLSPLAGQISLAVWEYVWRVIEEHIKAQEPPSDF